MKHYELVIFDCDGTLVDSEPLTMKLMVRMMGEMGLLMSHGDALKAFAGKNIMYITDHMQKSLGPFDHEEFENDYRKRCLDIFHNELKAIEGVEGLIDSLTIPKCIASNGPRSKMNVTLKVTELDRFFSDKSIFSAYDIGKWKPEPHLYLHAADIMKKKVQGCIVVEDTIPGIMGAVNAGMDVIAYNPDQSEELYLDGVLNFTSMTDIRDYFIDIGIAKKPTY